MKKILLSTFILFVISAIGFQTAIAGKRKSVEFLNPDTDSNSTLPFSKAVRVDNTVYLSGQLGIDPATRKLVEGGIKAEAKQTMTNIQNLLTTLGYTTSDLVKCTVMLADIAEWGTFNEVYVTFFSKPYPARSAFAASGLALNARVEVECIAAAKK